ncbi:unnamed protein product [Dovyalis caffra]|uniref:Uncharacterized protein n=1 Tax=Dovyalis caffra TaxID=77055 RepID=A0AAV1SRX4_9ROSI|nr:unnamed protein product [Dovyalis caffra]
MRVFRSMRDQKGRNIAIVKRLGRNSAGHRASKGRGGREGDKLGKGRKSEEEDVTGGGKGASPMGSPSLHALTHIGIALSYFPWVEKATTTPSALTSPFQCFNQ